MTEITIDSWIMPSESRHYIKPFLQHIKDTYGTPLVVIRDMSKEISGAASEIYPGVAHQIYWIAKSIEEDSLKLHKKDIRRYCGVLKSKRDALKFERDIRNEWDRQISN